MPTNSSHIRRFSDFLCFLNEKKGFNVSILLVDKISEPKHRTATVSRNFQFDYSELDTSLRWSLKFKSSFYKPFIAFMIRRDVKKYISENKSKIDLLVFGADSGIISSNFSKLAKRKGIKTALMVDGVVPFPIIKFNIIYSFIGFYNRLFSTGGKRGQTNPNYVFLMNKSGKDIFKNNGAKDSEFIWLGNPILEENTENNVKSFEFEIPFGSDLPIVFYAHHETGMTELEKEKLIVLLVELAEKEGFNLVVKFHPRDNNNVSKWNKSFKSGNVIFCKDEYSTTQILGLSDILITIFSTVTYEAMNANVPVILIKFVKSFYRLHYVEDSKAAVLANNEDELRREIKKLFSETDYRTRYIQRGRQHLIEDIENPNGFEQAKRVIDEL